MTGAVWFVSLERPGARAEWDCDSLGPPDPRQLLPTRRPRSGDFSRHVPRGAHAVTTQAPIELESGLEHDLLRWLDLRVDVRWLVAQPVLFHFSLVGRRRAVLHTPDLLSQHEDGTVTLWNARPKERHDDDFLLRMELAEEACDRVGWRHQVFTGLPTATRMNLLWLYGYRRRLPWHAQWKGELVTLLRAGPRLLGEVMARDDGSGELTATMWHLIADGKVSCDLARPLRESSTLTWRRDVTSRVDPQRQVAPSPFVLGGRVTDVLTSMRIQRSVR